jgi:hypothetical protein
MNEEGTGLTLKICDRESRYFSDIGERNSMGVKNLK